MNHRGGDATDGLLLRALRIELDGRVLLDVDRLHVPPASCTVMVGPGDAGKTLLASALAGAVPGARGELRLDGRAVAGPPSARRRAGLAAVPDQPLRLQGITVAEALALGAARRRDRGRRVSDAFDRFPLLARRGGLRCERLSGGEHHLLRLACAWVGAPRALVFDSPTAGLAADVAESVVALARDEAARGVAVLWLDQAGAPLPGPAALRIAAGRISAAAE